MITALHPDSHNPRISVIVPIYKVEEYLPRCLDSIIGNTYQNLEIICVNDGSPDGCLRILREYEKQDARIIVIDKENGGLSSARNAGMEVASGEFIAFIDSDDWIHPQYFEILLHFQRLTHADITIAQHVCTTDEKSFSFDPLAFDSIEYQTLNSHMLSKSRLSKNCVWGRLYRHDLIRHHRFVEGMLFEDTPFNITLFIKHDSITGMLVDAPLYAYFSRSTSIVHTTSLIKRLEVCRYYLRILPSVSDERKKEFLVLECIKKTLSYRYELLLLNRYKDVQTCNTVLHEGIKALISISSISKVVKLRYTLLIPFPFLYRIFRIIDDPTLLKWERSIKEERKSQPLNKKSR